MGGPGDLEPPEVVLQKLTLLDWPGRVACTIFLGGCDFRCPFCHNRDLVTGPLPAAMDSGELLAFLAKRKGLLDGVCVTGGEPLLRPGLEALLEEILGGEMDSVLSVGRWRSGRER